MKYVILRGTSSLSGDTHEVPFIFPGIVNHNDFERFRRYKFLQDVEIISAGFVYFGANGAVCEGRSESLRMNSRGQIDADIIDRANQHMSSTIVKEL